MRLKEVMEHIDAMMPFALAEKWDHSGLRLGHEQDEVRSVMVCLDPSPQAVRLAASLGCQLMITHHPLLFNPAESMVLDRIDSKTIKEAFSLGVDIVSCHTNFDSAQNGVNHQLAQMIGLRDICPLEPSVLSTGFGMGAVGGCCSQSVEELCRSIAKDWGLSGYRFFEHGEKISRMALCGGAGGDLWRRALQMGACLYVTADMRYHEIQEAYAAGLSLMICDHGEMETPPLRALAVELQSRIGLPVMFRDVSLWGKFGRNWQTCGNVPD